MSPWPQSARPQASPDPNIIATPDPNNAPPADSGRTGPGEQGLLRLTGLVTACLVSRQVAVAANDRLDVRSVAVSGVTVNRDKLDRRPDDVGVAMTVAIGPLDMRPGPVAMRLEPPPERSWPPCVSA